jgi:arylsulfatase A-like enzyme
LLYAFGCKPEEAPKYTRPNIILFIADDISWDDFACYSNPDVKTPVIDQLAANGLRFQHMYLTASSCSPSRTSLISGRYPHNTGAPELHLPLPAEVPVFPEFLQASGYFTGMSGKWHIGPHATRAFDTLIMDDRFIGNSGSDAWLNLLALCPKEKPYFLWLAALDAHRSWGENAYSGTHKPEDLTVPSFLVDSPATRADLASYYDEIYRFDRRIGEVLEAVKQQGDLENTLVLIMADNGRPFPRSKTRLIDSGIKTPFIVSWPAAIQQPVVTEALFSAIDIAPTLLEAAGITPGPSFQGISFLQHMLSKPEEPFRQYVFAESNWHDHEAYGRMVRTPDFMYLINKRTEFPLHGPADSNSSPSFQDLLAAYRKGELNPFQAALFQTPVPDEQFFDCRTDALQQHDLILSAEHAPQISQLRQILAQWQQATGDYLPEKLTQHTFDLFTGVRIADYQQVKGELPGTRTQALGINAKGPY